MQDKLLIQYNRSYVKCSQSCDNTLGDLMGRIQRMVGIGDNLDWGGASAPADHIRSPAEVPPTGVGLRAARHPRHRDGVSAIGGRDVGHLPPRPISGGHIPDLWEVDHWWSQPY